MKVWYLYFKSMFMLSVLSFSSLAAGDTTRSGANHLSSSIFGLKSAPYLCVMAADMCYTALLSITFLVIALGVELFAF